MDHEARLSKLRGRFEDVGVHGAVITHRENVAYLCGFDGSASTLVVTADDAYLFTDSRYEIQASRQVVGASVEVPPDGIMPGAAKWVNGLKGRPVLCFEGERLTVNAVEDLRAKLKRATLVPEERLVEGLRAVKDADELKLIRRAVRMMDRHYRAVIDAIQAGATELELAVELECRVRRDGGRESFSAIVASGPHSAIPHHQPTSRRLRRGDLLKIDCGARVGGYCSDMTRTICVGAPRNARQGAMYEAVYAAETAAAAAVRPGATGEELNRIARDAIFAAGFEDGCYRHGLGHGVGREIHEWPSLGGNAKEPLEVGHVVTIEPGIYVEGFGGVRIEDMVVVTDSGREVLTRSPKPASLFCVG